MSTDVSTSTPERVPVEHRVMGLDKRSFPYGLFVLAVFLLATVVAPRVNAAIDWDDPVRAGDQLALTDEIVITPTTGWNVESGFRLDNGTVGQSGAATLTSNGVTFHVAPDAFSGDPDQLLEQVEKVTSSTDDPTFKVEADPATVTTPAGDVGVIQTYSSVNGDGLIAAFVIDGTGLEVTAYGPPAQMTAAASDIDDMIASIHTVDADGNAS